jgi:hypothetical protein
MRTQFWSENLKGRDHLEVLGVDGRKMLQLCAPAVLPPGKVPCYPLYRSLGGPRIRSGHGGEEKISQPLPGLEPPIIQPVNQRYATELS